VKGLDDLKDRLDFLPRNAGGKGKLVRGGLQKPVVIDVADDHLCDRCLDALEFGHPHLLDQVFLKRGLHGQGVEHVLSAFLLVGGGAVHHARL